MNANDVATPQRPQARLTLCGYNFSKLQGALSMMDTKMRRAEERTRRMSVFVQERLARYCR